MPFKSEKQRRFLWLKHPELAKRWAHEYPESNKGLPMRVEKSDSKEKAAALAVLGGALAKHAVTLTTNSKSYESVINDDGTIKKSNDGLVRVELPKTEGPTYAGQEQEQGKETSCKKDLAPNSEKPLDLNNPVAAKLATVLSQALREKLERQNAVNEGREPLPVPRNMGIKRYAVAPQLHQLPMGMQPQAPAQGQAPPSNGPVGGGNNPTANPIKAFGPLSASGQLNGNAAFGVKNSPDSSKTAGVVDGLLSTRKLVSNYLSRLAGKSRLPFERNLRLMDDMTANIDHKNYKETPQIATLMNGLSDGGVGNPGGAATARRLGDGLRSAVFGARDNAQKQLWNEEAAIKNTRLATGLATGLAGTGAGLLAHSATSGKSASIRESIGNFLRSKNEDSAVDPKWGLLGGPLVTAPAMLANLAYGKMVMPGIFKTHDPDGYRKMLQIAEDAGAESRSVTDNLGMLRNMSRGDTNPLVKWWLNNQRRGLQKQPGAYDLINETILTNPKYRAPAVVAHELGHHQGGKALGLAGLLGKNLMGLGTAGALWSGDENTSKNFALGGTAAAAPMMASELDASWRGMRAMQRAGLKGGWRAFGGVPTYAAVAATPMLAHYGKKYFGGFDPAQKQSADSGAWTRAEGKNPDGGLNAKGRASLKAQGHDIKAPVTESNPSGERAQRQNSFCSRMCGMKKHETGAKTKSDPDSRINKSLRKWNCKCSSAYEFGKQAAGAMPNVNPALLTALRQLGQNLRNAGRESSQLARMNLTTLAPKTTELFKRPSAANRVSSVLEPLAPLLSRGAATR